MRLLACAFGCVALACVAASSAWGSPAARGASVSALFRPPVWLAPRSAAAATDASGVVVSQVYGGGGNSGATYTNDFVELFNPTGAPVSLAGASVQYASASGSTWQATALGGAIQAHGYYLVQEAAGSGGTTALPTPDATGSIALSASAGKVALVSSATALSGTCPAGAVDLVGFGGASCSEGSPAPGLSNTTADLRAGGGCVDTNSNAADFATGSPAPRNSASPANACGGQSNAAPTISCGPAVSTTSGTAASQQIAATDADGRVASIAISSVSPSSGQPSFSIDGLTPAAAAGGTATATLEVAATAPPGTYTVQLQAANDDPAPQTATCSLAVSVAAAPTVLPIGTVQGSVPDSADGSTFTSPYVNQTVTVQGVVTELTFDGGYHGFYLQNTAAEADADPNSSDGIFVFTSTFTDLKNGYVPQVGDDIRLTGKVSEHFDQTELGSATATKVGTGVVTPFAADPPDDAADAARYWERREGMQATVATGSVVDSPRHVYASSTDTELYVIAPDNPIALRADPYARRSFRDAHPLDDRPGTFDDGNGYRILITDEGIKAADPSAQLPAVHTFQTIAAPVTGGVYYDFGSYSVSVATQPVVADGADPSQNDPPQAFDRSQGFSIANVNLDNLYDFRDDPFDGCDFAGNPGCPGVTPPFDYPPASDAEYQQRETEIAHQIVTDLHAPDVIVVAEAEDQDICTVQSWTLVCGTTNDADGKPDVLQELAIHIHQLGGPDYDAANDRDGADARGIVSAFLYRTDRVSILPAAASDPVLGSSPAVQYRGTPLDYDTQVQDPKALNAVLPSDVDVSTGHDGTNVFTRAAQVAHFRIAPPVLGGSPSDVWVIANHFTSGPDTDIGQRREQAAYNAALVQAIQSGDPQAKVMVAGDLNDYPRPDDPIPPSAGGPSDQLAPLYDAGLKDLYDTVLANDPSSAYSYVFQGQAQDLDHQFVTPSLFAGLQAVNEAHINSDWTLDVPGDARGTSDHDPMVSRWSIPAGVTYDGVCDLVRQHTTNARLATTICNLLAKAEADAAEGRRVQRALDLTAAGAAIAVGVADGSLTRQDGVQLAKLLTRL
jgi:predicted extracellular nuclease